MVNRSRRQIGSSSSKATQPPQIPAVRAVTPAYPSISRIICRASHFPTTMSHSGVLCLCTHYWGPTAPARVSTSSASAPLRSGRSFQSGCQSTTPSRNNYYVPPSPTPIVVSYFYFPITVTQWILVSAITIKTAHMMKVFIFIIIIIIF